MDDVSYRVNHGGLDQVYAELNRRTQEIRSILNDLERATQATLGAWEGDAQRTYHAAKAEWNSAADTMATMLAARSTALNNINQNYQAQDRSAAGLFGR